MRSFYSSSMTSTTATESRTAPTSTLLDDTPVRMRSVPRQTRTCAASTQGFTHWAMRLRFPFQKMRGHTPLRTFCTECGTVTILPSMKGLRQLARRAVGVVLTPRSSVPVPSSYPPSSFSTLGASVPPRGPWEMDPQFDATWRSP